METRQRKPSGRARTGKKPQQDVVYTQPKPFIRNRFLLRLATVAAVVLALVFGTAHV